MGKGHGKRAPKVYPGQVLAAGGTQVTTGGTQLPTGGTQVSTGGTKVARGRDVGGTLSRPAHFLEASIR